ncbi:MAG: ribonuclease E inhibitor RraB [Pseudorhodobacter sp.]|nr:ribonuclease E inhibitor RraB [Pseudorhodobacter sp.]
MAHDFAAQRRETFDTFASLPKGQTLPESAVVDFLFFLEETDANWKGFEKALQGRGFTTKRDADYLIASYGPMPVTAEAIWEQEKAATELALAYDFYPDGWDLGED